MPSRNPFDDLERMVERMDRQFRALDDELREGGIAVDVEDRGDEFVVTADVPGFQKDDITVKVEDETLFVTAQHDREVETDGEFIRQERSRREVSRSLRLPETVQEDATTATYENGVLTVTLPKRSSGSGVSIDVE